MPTDTDLPLAARMEWTASFVLEHMTSPGGDAAKALERHRRELVRSQKPPRGEPVRRPVDEVSGLSPAEFRRRYMSRPSPCVFRGAAKNWRCCREWSLESFGARFAQDEVRVIDPVGIGYGTTGDGYTTVTMGEFVKRVADGGLDYLRFSPFALEHPELGTELDLAWLKAYRGFAPRGELQFFIGAQGTTTPLHAGIPTNFFVQVRGRKRWRIYPPNIFLYIDPPAARLHYYYSDANPDKPDAVRFPLFPLADCYETTLEPGDILWNPPYWWHYVENVDGVSIGVGYRTTSVYQAYKSSPLLTAMRFFARNPNIFVSLVHLLRRDKFMIYSAMDSRREP